MKLITIAIIACAVVSTHALADPITDQQVKSFSDTAVKAVQACEKAKQDARNAASYYEQIAELRARQKAADNPAYQSAKDDLANAQRALEQAQTLNNPSLINNASSQINQLNAAITKMESDAAEADVDVVAAKTILAQIDGKPAPGTLFRPAAPAAPAAPPPYQPVAALPVSVNANGSAVVPADRPVRPHVGVLTYPAGVHLSGEMIGRLIHGGWDALMAQQYDDATTMFNRATGVDTRDAVALLGRGIARYETKDYKAASKDLERAYSISAAGGSARLSRQLVVATAATAMMDTNPMRAVKLIEDYLKATAKRGVVDEELQNDLGTALAHVDNQARLLQVYDEALRYYMTSDKALNEKKTDGTARWGTTWITTGAAQQKWQVYGSAVANANQATYVFQHAGMAVVRANDHYQEITGGLRLHSTAEIQQYTAELKNAAAAQIAAQGQMNAAVARLQNVEKPPFPDRIEYDWSEPR